MIKAVVLDIGSVLEVVDDLAFPTPFEERHGLAPGSVARAAESLPGDAGLGEMTEAEVRQHWQHSLRLDDGQVDELLEDFWRWYVGELDEVLFAWFAAQRPTRRTGIISNSAPGAREHERHWGFEEVTDVLVYSHEVGLAKPDPAIFALTTRRLGVEPSEVVFLDDDPGHVEAARAAGWHAVDHLSTADSIRAMEQTIADEAARA